MQENSFTHITTGIVQVIDTEEKLLSSLPVEVITQRRNRQNRTIKQILGHLIGAHLQNGLCDSPDLDRLQAFRTAAENRLSG